VIDIGIAVALLLLGAFLGIVGVACAVVWSRREDFDDAYRAGWMDATDRAPLGEPLDPLEPPAPDADPRDPWRH
jgi:hypothetical protein